MPTRRMRSLFFHFLILDFRQLVHAMAVSLVGLFDFSSFSRFSRIVLIFSNVALPVALSFVAGWFAMRSQHRATKLSDVYGPLNIMWKLLISLQER